MKIYKTQFLLEFIDLDYESPPRHFVLVEIIIGNRLQKHIQPFVVADKSEKQHVSVLRV